MRSFIGCLLLFICTLTKQIFWPNRKLVTESINSNTLACVKDHQSKEMQRAQRYYRRTRFAQISHYYDCHRRKLCATCVCVRVCCSNVIHSSLFRHKVSSWFFSSTYSFFVASVRSVYAEIINLLKYFNFPSVLTV